MMQPGQKTCYYSILITLLLVGVYWLGHGITLPGMDIENLSRALNISTKISKNLNIFTLGYAPFLSSFFIVEIFSLILPAGRRMRKEGRYGRVRLTRAAMGLSVAVCIFQSLLTASAMENLDAVGGYVIVPNPGWSFRFLTCVTLTAGAFAVFFIAQIISRKGIANGFCVLIAVDILAPVVRQSEPVFSVFRMIGSICRVEYLGLLGVTILTLFTCYRRAVSTTATLPGSECSINFDLPEFPQGIVPLVWSVFLFNLTANIRSLLDPGSSGPYPGFKLLLPATAILIIVFSVIGVFLFSSRKRIEYNLPSGIRLGDNLEPLLSKQTIKGASVLIGGSTVLLIFEWQLDWNLMPGYAGMVFLIAITLDAIDQWRFTWKHGRGIELIELDNPHLACFLKNLLESKGIVTIVQAYRYRRLLFFFNPLTKMRLLIASEDRESAMKLIDLDSMQII